MSLPVEIIFNTRTRITPATLLAPTGKELKYHKFSVDALSPIIRLHVMRTAVRAPAHNLLEATQSLSSNDVLHDTLLSQSLTTEEKNYHQQAGE